MQSQKFLVTGAAGKTGSEVVNRLRDRGYQVRAMVRSFDERSERLRSLGAEVVIGDFHDMQSIRSALDGVNRAYFCYPPQGTGLVDATTIFAIAARDVGVEAVVNMSQITARELADSPLSRQHWQAEYVFDWANIGAVHVRPTFFADNLFMFGAQTIASEGKLYLPYGSEKHAPIASSDIAEVVVKILEDPKPHLGQRYVLTGPKLMSIDEIADELSSALGIPVEYVDLPGEAWADVLRGVPRMSASLVTHLVAVAGDHRNGIFHSRTDDVERITGAAPLSLGEFVERTKESYGFSRAATKV